jgi:hypothetical protein
MSMRKNTDGIFQKFLNRVQYIIPSTRVFSLLEFHVELLFFINCPTIYSSPGFNQSFFELLLMWSFGPVESVILMKYLKPKKI